MPVPTTLGQGWLLAEDTAMKTYLSGMTVTDSTAGVTGRKVETWFRLPEAEQRERTYPYIAIDLIDIVEANQRAMVNLVNVSGLPYRPPDPLAVVVSGSTAVADRPVPVDIHYQIMSVARSARHDRQLQALLWRKFPGKWGALYVPNDETARTMQLLGRSTAYDTDQYGKRTFRTMWTVTVASELWPTQAEVIRNVRNLTEINISVNAVTDPSAVQTAMDCYE